MSVIPETDRVLVVEDEPRTFTFVARALRAEGLTVTVADDGRHGLAHALADGYGLVILDLMLPGLDGLALLDELRARKPDLPVLILTARADLETKLRGFDLGANDYLVKPFALDELIARARVQLRRGPELRGPVLRAGSLTLDCARREARVNGSAVRLTDCEFRLLHQFVKRGGDVISREQLLADVWGYDFDPRSNVLDVAIRRLRRKLGSRAPIETVRNVGYRLAAE